MSVSSTSRSAPIRIATWAARKSLSPNEISSVVVVSFSLITGTTCQRSSVRRVWRARVVAARRHVEERQQYLGARHAARPQQLVVAAIEPTRPTAEAACSSSIAEAHREAHDAHAVRDRARRHDHKVVARASARGDLVADSLEHLRSDVAGVIRHDARAELHHDCRHRGRRLGAGLGSAASQDHRRTDPPSFQSPSSFSRRRFCTRRSPDCSAPR